MVTPGVRDASLPFYRGHWKLIALGSVAALLWVVASWLIANHEHDRQIDAALHHDIQEARLVGTGIVSGVKQILSLRSGVAATLAENQQIRHALMERKCGYATKRCAKAAASWETLNQFLANSEKHLSLGALWVGDAAGKGFAAGNAGTPASPIGVDYNDRVYFQEAKAGRRGHQFAVGRTTKIPGIFFSAPVKQGNRFLGFVVVKIDLSSMAAWVNQADAFLSDNHGIIVLARAKNLEMRALPNAGFRRLDAAVRQNTYRRTEFPELSITPWDDARYPALQRLDHGDVPVILTRYALPEYDLELNVTQPFPQLASLDRQRDIDFAFLASLGIILLAGLTSSAIYLKNMRYSRQLLGQQKQQLDEAQRLARLGSWELDLGRNLLTWSEASDRIFERETSIRSMSYEAYLDAIHPDDRAMVDRAYQDSVARRVPGEIEHRVLLADGRIKHMHARWKTDYDAGGKPRRSLGSVQDISKRKMVEAQLRLAASVFENAHEGICITDSEQRILDINATFCETTGYSRAEVLGKTPRILKSDRQSPEFYAAMWQAIASEGHWQGEVWNRRKDGRIYAERLTISVVRDTSGTVSHYVGVLSDITATKEHEQRLERIAHYDMLTDVPNRTLLADRMRQAIAQTGRSHGMLAVCYLDLDGFKTVNDNLGHEAGDRLLVEIAARLQSCLRGGDTVARLGGDEFVLLLLGLDEIEECRIALQRILETLNRPVGLAGGNVAVSASIGVTLYPQDNVDADSLLRHADHAMYRAKRKGKNRFEFFDPQSMSPATD
ncbi:MAG: diguanylate cyclase [Betaproteobacteria bacterium]|nr:diguanylate cyclase [Betaproteobacteria bacterium]